MKKTGISTGLTCGVAGLALLAGVVLVPVVSTAQGLPGFRSTPRTEYPAAPAPDPVVAPKSEATPLDPVEALETEEPVFEEESAIYAPIEPEEDFVITETVAEPAPVADTPVEQAAEESFGEQEFVSEAVPEVVPEPEPVTEVVAIPDEPIDIAKSGVEIDPSIYRPMLDPLETLRSVPNLETRTLYVRLGGRQELKKVVRTFVDLMLEDDRINGYFSDINRYRLETLLSNQFCEATGGFCMYAGGDMQNVHDGMGISTEEFQITGEHLATALDRSYIPEREKQELLALVGSMAGDIVGR